MNNTQNQIEQLFALIVAYSNVSHLVDCGELVWKAHQAIERLEEQAEQLALTETFNNN